MKSRNKIASSIDFTAPAGDVSPSQIPFRDAEIIRLTEIIHSQTSTIRSQDIKIKALVQEVAYLRRIRYGVKSEAMSPEQRQLFDEDVVQDIAAIESELKLPATPAAPRSRAGRQVLPEHLERVDVRHEPESCTCSACQSSLVKIGEDISEQLDVEPARFFVIRHIRPQYACRQCETITAAPVAPAVIDGSLAAPGLLAWVVGSAGDFDDRIIVHTAVLRFKGGLEQINHHVGMSVSRTEDERLAARSRIQFLCKIFANNSVEWLGDYLAVEIFNFQFNFVRSLEKVDLITTGIVDLDLFSSLPRNAIGGKLSLDLHGWFVVHVAAEVKSAYRRCT